MFYIIIYPIDIYIIANIQRGFKFYLILPIWPCIASFISVAIFSIMQRMMQLQYEFVCKSIS